MSRGAATSVWTVAVALMLALPAGAVPFDDIVVFRPGSAQWFLSHNPGPPSFYSSTPPPAPVTSQTNSGLVGIGDAPLVDDVTGDGLDDIVIVRPAGNYSWFAGHTADANNDGAGELVGGLGNSFLPGFGTVAGSSGNFLADINGDGADDAITINAGFNWFAVPSGPGGLSTGGPLQGPVQWGLVQTGDQPIVGDFNGDGNDDIGVVRNGFQYFTGFTTAGGQLYSQLFGDDITNFGLPGDIHLVGQFNAPTDRIPEPATITLLALGAFALLRRRRRAR